MSHLHIYGQAHPHDDVLIAGSREALVRLRNAIDRALAENSAASGEMTTDGEGYAVVVIRASAEEMSALAMPYSDERFVGKGRGAYELLGPGRYRALVEATYEETR